VLRCENFSGGWWWRACRIYGVEVCAAGCDGWSREEMKTRAYALGARTKKNGIINCGSCLEYNGRWKE